MLIELTFSTTLLFRATSHSFRRLLSLYSNRLFALYPRRIFVLFLFLQLHSSVNLEFEDISVIKCSTSNQANVVVSRCPNSSSRHFKPRTFPLRHPFSKKNRQTCPGASTHFTLRLISPSPHRRICTPFLSTSSSLAPAIHSFTSNYLFTYHASINSYSTRLRLQYSFVVIIIPHAHARLDLHCTKGPPQIFNCIATPVLQLN